MHYMDMNMQYREKYISVSSCIENVWNKNEVNIEYLTERVVAWIQACVKDFSGEGGLLFNLNLMDIAMDTDICDDLSPLTAILYVLEPEQWIHKRKDLKKMNQSLILAYKNDTELNG